MKKMHKRLISALLCLTMFSSIASSYFDAFGGIGEIQQSVGGEISAAQESIPDTQTVESITEALIATPAVAYIREDIRFEGLSDTQVEAGETISLTEGVSAEAQNLDMDLGITPIAVVDSTGLPVEIEVNGTEKSIEIPEVPAAEYFVTYAAIADRDDVALINRVAEENAEGTDSSTDFVNSFNEEKTRREAAMQLSTAEQLSADTAVNTAILAVSSEVQSETLSTPSSSVPVVTSAFRRASGFPVAARVRRLGAGFFALPSGSPNGNHTTASVPSYTTVAQVGTVSYNGGNIGAGGVTGAYIELKAPKKYISTKVLDTVSGRIEGLDIQPGNYVESVEYSSRMFGTEEYVVARAYLKKIESSTDAQIPYKVKFKDSRIVPEDYRLPVDADLRIRNESVTWAALGLEFYTPKYDKQGVFMYLGSNTHNAFRYDSWASGGVNGAYGGPVDAARTYVLPGSAVDVPLKFKLQTQEPASSYSNYNTDKPKNRLIQKIDVFVDIPTYTDIHGNLVRAKFDAASNPDWTVIGWADAGHTIPSKVKLTNTLVDTDTIETAATQGKGADELLNAVQLNLKYPNIPVNVLNPNTDGGMSPYITDANVAIVAVPYDASANEIAATDAVRDAYLADAAASQPFGTSTPTAVATNPAANATVTDRLQYNIFRAEVSPTGIFSKHPANSPVTTVVYLNEEAMAETSSMYTINFKNSLTSSISNVSIKDYLADDRLYFKNVLFRFWDGDWTKLKRIWALDAAGNRTTLIKEFLPADHAALARGEYYNAVALDTVADAGVQDLIRQVNEGAVGNTLPAVSRSIQGFEMEMDPSYVMPIGASYSFRVEMGFRDPYRVDKTVDAILENEAHFLGRFTNSGGVPTDFDVRDDATPTLSTPVESISFSKLTNPHAGTVGSNVDFRIQLMFNGTSPGRWFRNAKVVDILPKGLEYVSHSWGDPLVDTGPLLGYNPFKQVTGSAADPTVVETIDDYQGTGRQAVIFKFPDFKPGMIHNPGMPYGGDYFRMVMKTKITENALAQPTNLSAAERIQNANTSLNRAFFTADGLYNDLSDNTQPGSVVPGGNGKFSDNRTAASNTDNTGVAGLIPDEFDVDGDGQTNDKVLGTRSTVNIIKERAVEAFKEIRSLGTTEYSSWRRSFVRTDYGAEYDYRLVLINTKDSNVPFLTIYDILPYDGDAAYTGHETRIRDSKFKDRMRGPITNPDPTRFDIYYSTAANPPVNAQAAVADPGMGWTTAAPADWSTVTAFKIVMRTGMFIPPNQELKFEVPMKAPQKPAAGIYDDEKATNYFVISYDNNTIFNASNLVDNYLVNELPVEKFWSDGTAGKPAVEALLKQDGTVYTSAAYPDGKIALNTGNSWKNKFTGIPLTKTDGSPYVYTIEEVGAGIGFWANYTTVISGDATTLASGSLKGFKISNHLKKPIRARIDWYDGVDTDNNGIVDTTTNRDNLRPSSVKVRLQRSTDGITYTDVAPDAANPSYNTAITTISDDGSGSYVHTYTDMPAVMPDGTPYQYRIVELAADQDASLNNYPQTLTDAGGTAVANRVSSVEGDGTLVVSNVIERYPFSITKNWDDAANPSVRPASVSFKVQRKTGTNAPADVMITGVTTQKSLPDHGLWTVSFGDFPRYDASGTEFDYSVIELGSPGMNNYSTDYHDNQAVDDGMVQLGQAASITVTNSLGNYGLRVRTDWVDSSNMHGVRPADTATKLYRRVGSGPWQAVNNSTKTSSPTSHASGTADGWVVEYRNLPKYDSMGAEYTYRVEQLDENGLRNYDTDYPTETGVAVSNPQDTVLVIRNRIRLIEKAANKQWEDDQEVVALRPANVVVDLKRKTASTAFAPTGASVTLNAGNNWTDNFTGLLRYDGNGEEFIYELEEQGVGVGPLARYFAPVYSTSADGQTLMVTNRLRIPTLDARVDWVDSSDALQVRPQSVRVQLRRQTSGGTPEDVGTPVTISAAGNWRHRFRNTPEFDPLGQRYTYTLVEIDDPTLNNYPSILRNGNPNRVFSMDGETLVITNIIQAIDIGITKNWIDDSNSYGARPNSMHVNLLRDNAVIAGADVSGTGDSWAYTFAGFAQYAPNGAEYAYAVTEDAAANLRNYSAQIGGNTGSGFVITNRLNFISLNGTKVWEHEVSDALRPANLRINLYRSDAPATIHRNTVISTANASNAYTWDYSFDHLVQYAPDGSAYSYTVTEDSVPAFYVQHVNGMTIQNVYTPTPVDFTPQIRKTANGRHVPSSEQYVFELKAIGNAPMPSGSTGGIKTISVPAGSHSFGNITFDYQGSYDYEIREIAGTTDGYTYDTSVYRMRVQVSDTLGILSTAVSYERIRDGAGENYSEILFENTYVRPEANLVITKRIPRERYQENYEFTIEMDSEEIFEYDGAYSGFMKNGDRFRLKNGESITIHNLPVGMKYKVTETAPIYFYPVYQNAEGRIVKAGVHATITNMLINPLIDAGKGGSGGSGGSGGNSRFIGGGSSGDTSTSNPIVNQKTESPSDQPKEPTDGTTAASDGSSTKKDTADHNQTGNAESSESSSKKTTEPADDPVISRQNNANVSPSSLNAQKTIAKVSGSKTAQRGSAPGGKTNAKSTPKTADDMDLLPWMMLILAGLCGFALSYRKKTD